MAKEIINVLDQKKIDKFNLIGHSMGGMIVQEITKLIGDRVNKLICFATGSIGDCLLYTSPSPRDAHESRMPSSA